jgi:hypothetical protein
MKKEIGREFYREVEEKVLVPLADAMRIQDKPRTTVPWTRCSLT